MVDPGGLTALFVAHPGHELTLHGWLARTHATVFVLTDGSGSHGISRLPSTTRLLEHAGARPGPVYGRFSDRDVYNALLQGATGAFEDVTRELAGWMCRNPVRAVVADSSEGYNPTHDLCRAMAGAAVALASRPLGRAVPLYEYVVTADRRACAEQSCAGAICSRLTDAELERKLRAAAEYEELTAESQLSIERDGAETYRAAVYVCHDRLSPADTPPVFAPILRHVAVDDNCRERLVESGVADHRIRVIANAVDLRRFRPRSRLPAAPRRALVFSNYASDHTHLPAVRHACTERGVALDVIGAASGRPQAAPEDLIGAYDLVFAKARCALEAMAVGSAVVLCDARGLGPMVTRAQVAHLRRWNFGMRTLTRALDPRLIGEEMARYDADDAAEVSRYVREAAGLDRGVEELVELYREVIAEYAALPARQTHVTPRTLRGALPRAGFRDRVRRVPGLGRALIALLHGATGRRLRAAALEARRRQREY